MERAGVAITIVRSNRSFSKRATASRCGEETSGHLEHAFAIGSTTKAFTTFLIGTLVDEGKLGWDKPVREFLPEFRLSDPRTTELITPRDLLTHRSGLPRHDLVWYNNTTSTRKDIVQRLAHLEATETLRAKFQYNNLMYIAAGYLVEHVTGKSWEENVRERILRPLDMTTATSRCVTPRRQPTLPCLTKRKRSTRGKSPSGTSNWPVRQDRSIRASQKCRAGSW